MKLYLFEAGVLKSQRHYFTLNQGVGESFDVPVPFVLIDHPKGNILFDTGNAFEVIHNKEEHWGAVVGAYDPVMTEEQWCVNAIKKVGIAPEDIRYVILSHLHLDHAGCVGHFPNAQYIVQREELHFAYVPDPYMKLAYIRKDFDKEVNWYADETVNTGRPLFEPVHKRVFISYARSSVWSSRVADEMAASLHGLGAFVFLDRPSLRPGLSWKRQLRWAIVNSNVFVVVLDHSAVRREWVAAEFTTAYRSKILKRTPEIFVIHPEEMDFSESDTPAEAFFSELMVKPSQAIPQWMRSRMAPYVRESRAEICRAIWAYPIAGSFGFAGNMILALASSVVVPVVGLACVLGLPLLFIQLLSIQGTVDLSALLAGHSGLALPIGFTSALLGGFSLRSAIRSFGDIRRSAYRYVPGPVELLEAVAFFGVVALCLPLLHLVDTCFVCLAVFFGLEWGNMFAVCMRTWKQQSA